jgi:hypothetical protein
VGAAKAGRPFLIQGEDMKYQEFMENLTPAKYNQIKKNAAGSEYAQLAMGLCEQLIENAQRRLLTCDSDNDILKLSRALQGMHAMMVEINPENLAAEEENDA